MENGDEKQSMYGEGRTEGERNEGDGKRARNTLPFSWELAAQSPRLGTSSEDYSFHFFSPKVRGEMFGVQGRLNGILIPAVRGQKKCPTLREKCHLLRLNQSLWEGN